MKFTRRFLFMFIFNLKANIKTIIWLDISENPFNVQTRVTRLLHGTTSFTRLSNHRHLHVIIYLYVECYMGACRQFCIVFYSSTDHITAFSDQLWNLFETSNKFAVTWYLFTMYAFSMCLILTLMKSSRKSNRCLMVMIVGLFQLWYNIALFCISVQWTVSMNWAYNLYYQKGLLTIIKRKK